MDARALGRVLCVALALWACDDGGGGGDAGDDATLFADGGDPDGGQPDGDLPDGDFPDGDLPDGDLPDGDLPDGDLPDGAQPDGDLPDGAGDRGVTDAGADAEADAEADLGADAGADAGECVGPDSDGDGVPDACDVCPDFDDGADGDGDGVACADDCDDDDASTYADAPELCDGVDNDCDEAIDEMLMAPLGARQDGVCAGARQTCDGENGWLEPSYAALADYEADEASCDGLDNDCDGATDEALVAPPASRNVGVCDGLLQSCAGDQGFQDPDFAQVADFEADEASCDGLDNDCDGATDEALVGGAASRQDGVCAGSTQACRGGEFVDPDFAAIDGYEADEASCDGRDNDCDGTTDEGFVAPPAMLQAGVCAGAVQVCRDGAPAEPDYGAIPGYEADEASCDAADNDCDGAVDEGFDVGAACVALGVCGAGVIECAPGGTRCSTEPGGSADGSTPEVCNGLDDDCDDAIDEGLDCPDPGDPDSAFGGDGRVVLQSCTTEEARGVVVDAEGRVVVAGACADDAVNWDMIAARLTSAGGLDADFGEAGVRRVDLAGRADQAYALLPISGAPGYVLAGYGSGAAGATPMFALLDGAGAVSLVVADGARTGSYRAAAAHGAGFILAGEVRVPGDGAVARVTWHTNNGTPDASAGAIEGQYDWVNDLHVRGMTLSGDRNVRMVGRVEAGADDNGGAVFVPRDGGAASVFEFDAGAGDTREHIAAIARVPAGGFVAVGEVDGDLLVLRIESDGTLDAGFAGGGRAVFDVAGGRDRALAVVVEDDGSFLIAGSAANDAGQWDAALFRVTAAGALDAGFGDGGVVRLDTGADSVFNSLALDGARVVAAGRTGGRQAGGTLVARFYR